MKAVTKWPAVAYDWRKKSLEKKILLIAGLLWCSAIVSAQAVNATESEIARGEKVSIAFRDPGRPGTVRLNAVHGSITVKAYAGKEVIVSKESRSAKELESDPDRELPAAAKGLRRLNATGGAIELEEENNVVTISLGWRTRGENLLIQVPVKTNLKLSSVNGKTLSVEGVEGELELSSTNGSVMLSDVAGSVVAHSINGKVVAKIRRIDGDKPMSFSSMNGVVDVTLPAATKANFKIQSNNGEVFTDFEVLIKPTAATAEKTQTAKGKNHVRMESMTQGSINGGGPEYSFRNYNGNIFIRKAN